MTLSALRSKAGGIAVFAKAPVPGAVKTRLAPLLGPAGAAALHAGLVRRALSTAIEAHAGPVELWCTPAETHPFFERCARDFGVALRRQVGQDLGERMQAAFAAAHSAGNALVLIGSDCPALLPSDLCVAMQALSSQDVVIQPAEDGGFVLIGLAAPVPQLFEGIAWGESVVMSQTRARLARIGVRWRELAILWDVDRPEDYARLQQEGLLPEVGS